MAAAATKLCGSDWTILNYSDVKSSRVSPVKIPIHTPFLRRGLGLENLTIYMESTLIVTPGKKHFAIAETRHRRQAYWQSKLVHLGIGLGAIPRITVSKARKKGRLRNRNVRQVTCSPRPPTMSQRHVDLHVPAFPQRRPSCILHVSVKPAQLFLSHKGSKFCHSHT